MMPSTMIFTVVGWKLPICCSRWVRNCGDLVEAAVPVPPERTDDPRGQPPGRRRASVYAANVSGVTQASCQPVMPERVEVLLREQDRALPLLARRLGHPAGAEGVRRAFVQHAARRAVVVALVPAVGRVRRRCVDAGTFQRGRVHPRAVDVAVEQERRTAAGDRVEILAARRRAREVLERPAAAGDPLRVGVGRDVAGDRCPGRPADRPCRAGRWSAARGRPAVRARGSPGSRGPPSLQVGRARECAARSARATSSGCSETTTPARTASASAVVRSPTRIGVPVRARSAYAVIAAIIARRRRPPGAGATRAAAPDTGRTSGADGSPCRTPGAPARARALRANGTSAAPSRGQPRAPGRTRALSR